MPTWTDDQLDRWMKEAEVDIVQENVFPWRRFSIALSVGTSTYSLNERLFKITDVLWKGKPLEPLIGREPHALERKYRTEQGEPRWYTVSHDGLSIIRLIPVPNEAIVEYDTGLFSSNIKNAFLVSGYVWPDQDLDYFQIPDYLTRRVVKAYTMWKAFSSEGIGQDLNNAQYWEQKYLFYRQHIRNVKRKFYGTKEDLDFFLNSSRRRRDRFLTTRDESINAPVFGLKGRVTDDLNSWSDSVNVVMA